MAFPRRSTSSPSRSACRCRRKPASPASARRRRARSRAADADDCWTRRRVLPAPAQGSPRAIDYLKGRGLTGEIAARFGLGYAPDGWRGLASVFPSYEDPLLEDSGLVIDSRRCAGRVAEESGKRYDRFRDRIMFPIHDVAGNGDRLRRPRARPGRAQVPQLAGDAGVQKGRELYGLFQARTAIRERGQVLVVEGYMDVVALAQHGVENAVATLGTAMHRRARAEAVPLHRHGGVLLRRRRRRPPRRVARARGSAAARRRHAHVRFLFLPAEHDPDTFVRERGAEAFEQRDAGGRAAVAPARSRWPAKTATSPPPRAGRAPRQASPLWSALPDGMLKRQLLGEFAARGALPVDELARRRGGRPRAAAAPADAPRARDRAPAPLGPRRRAAATRRADAPAGRSHRLDAAAGNGWWEQLEGADHADCCGLPGGTARCSASLERHSTEHGARPWAVLRSARRTTLGGDRARARRRRGPGDRAARRGPADARSSTARQRPSGVSRCACSADSDAATRAVDHYGII